MVSGDGGNILVLFSRQPCLDEWLLQIGNAMEISLGGQANMRLPLGCLPRLGAFSEQNSTKLRHQIVCLIGAAPYREEELTVTAPLEPAVGWGRAGRLSNRVFLAVRDSRA